MRIVHFVLFVLATASLPLSALADGTLRIGYQKYGTLVLLKANGDLDRRLGREGTRVTWTEFTGGPQLLEALSAGSIDFAVTGETPPVFAQAAGTDLVYVANEPVASRSEAILVPKDSPIQRVADLKGKRVALNKGSNVHYLLVRALQEAGLSYSDIKPVYLAPADGRAAFQNGSVDAWVIWDPYQAAAERQLQARTLRDGQNLVDNHQFYLSSRQYAQAHPKIITAVIEEVRRLDSWEQKNPAAVARQIAPLVGLPVDITQLAVERQGYGAEYIRPPVLEKQQRIADTFFNLGLIPHSLNIRQAVWQAPDDKTDLARH